MADNTFLAVSEEAERGDRKFGDFASMHEAYGVLAEEVAELFDAIRKPAIDMRAPPWSGRQLAIRHEAIQVAAVALRIAEQAGRVTR